MAKKEDWDFECPQYVDFQRELDSSGKDDIFFETTFYEEEMRYIDTKVTMSRYANEKKHADDLNIKEDCKGKTPEIGNLSTPDVQVKGKGLTESDENKLLGKMTAALSLLENTPKIKKSASRGKLFPESVYKGMISKTIKSTVKPYTVPALHPKSRRSKSLDHINKIITGKTNKGKKCVLRKSSSLNDLKTHNKMKYPLTPMCLKRTIFKAKDKIIKTTEEMELEQIAKLQKQLIQHLRQNEISLKKLNLRPRQCAVSKTIPKSDNLKVVKGALVEKLHAAEKRTRRNIQRVTQAAVKKGASKLDNEVNDENISNKKTDNTIYSRKSKALPVSSLDVNNHDIKKKEPSKQDNTINSEAASSKKTSYSRRAKTLSTADPSKLDSTVISEAATSKKTIYSRRAKTLSTAESDIYKDTVQKTKKLVHKRILDHSGLMFIPSVKNNILPKSFIFEEKIQDKPHVTGVKQKEISSLCVKENRDKENNDCIEPQFTSKKTRSTQNDKCDMNKVGKSNRITGKRITNHPRGVPLAENVPRD